MSQFEANKHISPWSVVVAKIFRKGLLARRNSVWPKHGYLQNGLRQLP